MDAEQQQRLDILLGRNGQKARGSGPRGGYLDDDICLVAAVLEAEKGEPPSNADLIEILHISSTTASSGMAEYRRRRAERKTDVAPAQDEPPPVQLPPALRAAVERTLESVAVDIWRAAADEHRAETEAIREAAERKVAEAAEQLAEVHRTNDDLAGRLQGVRDQVATLQVEVQDAQDKKHDAEEALRKLQENLGIANGLLEEARAARAAAEEQLSIVRADNVRLETERTKAEDAAATAREEAAALQRQVASLTTQLAEERAAAGEVKAERDRLVTENARLAPEAGRVPDLTKRITELGNDAKAFQEAAKRAAEEIARLSGENGRLASAAAQVEQLNTQLREEQAKCERIASDAAGFKAQADRIPALEQQIRELTAALARPPAPIAPASTSVQ